MQIIKDILKGAGVKRWRVPSSSIRGRFYEVMIDKFGDYYCSCPVLGKRQCKHILIIKQNYGRV